jgi:PAS domain S-box-containing protein
MNPTIETAPVANPVNVLIVDDHQENRTALRALLSSPDYRIIEAGSGIEALRCLLEEEFAVLLIDVVMPEMNGFELAKAIKERERTATVPIVFITAYPTASFDNGYRAGAVDYLVTPLVPDIVRAKVGVFAQLYRQRKRIEWQTGLLVDAERKEGELRLTQLRLASERRYRSLAEAVPNIVWTARPDGSVDYFNQRWFEYTGIAAVEAAGSWERAVHPDDQAAARTEWLRALATRQMLEFECRLRRSSDGAFRWHLCRALPEEGSSGQVEAWLGTFTDIEDQKRAQAVLAEFKGTLDAVLDAVIIFDSEDWRVLYANHGASVVLGCSMEELERSKPTEIFSEYDAQSFRELMESLETGSRPLLTIETQIRRRGRKVPLEVSLQRIRIEGGRIVAIARDITERKRAQLERELLYREAVDAIRARDEFLHVASHELRTPISALKLQLESLLRTGREKGTTVTLSQVSSKLEVAARQTERLSTLVSELLDVSKITAKRLVLNMEEMDLADAVRDVVARMGEEASKAGCQLVVSADSVVTGTWDRMRVEQVVTNLLSNAIKFGAGKPIELSVQQEGPHARLTVSDHGMGISPEDTERIFRRYEQAANARAYGGLGLGLYIVNQIVQAHGGDIRVESRTGEGSTFTVELPREPATSGRADEAANA